MPASSWPFQRFLDHRAVCGRCFFYSLLQRDAPLCEEGLELQKQFLPLWDKEDPNHQPDSE